MTKAFGSQLSGSDVKVINAYGWGLKVRRKSLSSLAVSLFGLMHLGSRIRNRIVYGVLNREDHLQKELLDAGCGIGLETVYLSPLFKRVLGVDIDREKIVEAKKLARKNKTSNVDFVVADLVSNKIALRPFDVVICLEVIEHVTSDKKFLSTLSRALSKKGMLVLSFPSKTLLSKIAQDSLKHYAVGYNPESIKRLLKGTDLKIVEEHIYGRSLLGKMVIAVDFLFKKTLPVLSVVFFPLFYPLLLLDFKLPRFGIPRGFVLVLKKK